MHGFISGNGHARQVRRPRRNLQRANALARALPSPAAPISFSEGPNSMPVPKLSQVDFDTIAPLSPANVVAARVWARSSCQDNYYMPRPVAPEEFDTAGTKRTPVYLPDNPSIRMISRANGLWRVERRVTERGTREADNWAALSRATSKEEAGRLLLAFTQFRCG
jgi:hypothetical protein